MPKRRNVISVFFFFLLVSCLLYALSFTPFGHSVTGFGEFVTRPLSHGIFSVYASTQKEPSELQKLKDENATLQAKLALYKEQDKEIQALRDQFSVNSPRASSLLPAQIIGLKAFIPGYSLPEQIVIDKGLKDGVKNNDAVIYKNYLVGKVLLANDHVSLIDLTFRKGFSVTTTTADTNALGISKGQGGGKILLDNVVLSDSLTKEDFVVTKGSTDVDESGIPPGLIIGRITSVDKKPSSLFQTANVQLPIDITRVTSLFIILKSE